MVPSVLFSQEPKISLQTRILVSRYHGVGRRWRRYQSGQAEDTLSGQHCSLYCSQDSLLDPSPLIGGRTPITGAWRTRGYRSQRGLLACRSLHALSLSLSLSALAPSISLRPLQLSGIKKNSPALNPVLFPNTPASTIYSIDTSSSSTASHPQPLPLCALLDKLPAIHLPGPRSPTVTSLAFLTSRILETHLQCFTRYPA